MPTMSDKQKQWTLGQLCPNVSHSLMAYHCAEEAQRLSNPFKNISQPKIQIYGEHLGKNQKKDWEVC